MVLTLLWGGCVSCPQFYMFPGSTKDCCEKDGTCKKPAKAKSQTDCQRIALEPAVSPEAVMPVVLAERFLEPRVVALSLRDLETPLTDPSPPDLNLLHSVFLI